jgi:shikimate dehydrogenase
VKRAGIIGRPVAHSLSPVFQSAGFAACGLAARYEFWDTDPEGLGARLASLREADCLGANVTVPYKEAVLPYLDELGGQSARVGAVNTIVNRDGRLFGFNTDGPGFVAALRNEANYPVQDRNVLLLGAGGSARGIGFAANIGILNRSPDRAERLANDLRAAGGEVQVLSSSGAPDRFDAVINCTSIGMHGGPDPDGSPIDVNRLSPSALVVDIVYAPEETPLLRQARARGLRTFPGLPMLIYQGALAFELWTGVTAPVEAMFEAVRAELRRRESARTPAPTDAAAR